MTDTTVTLPALAEIQKAYTGPGKFWVGDRLPRAGRVYIGRGYVTVTVDNDWQLDVANGTVRAGERNQVSAALRSMNTGWHIRG